MIVARRWPEQVETRLAGVFDLRLNQSHRPMSQVQLRAALAQADAVFPTVSDRIDAEVPGTGFDVFETEPQATPALLELENVVLPPHLGSATLEARVAMAMTVLKNAQAFFAGEAPPNGVAWAARGAA